jgi:hypothetical protein
MRASDMTPESVVVAYAPMALLPGAPAMTEALYGAVYTLLTSEGVSQGELRQAVVDVLKSETFWPAPAKLLERIAANRKTELLARRDAEHKQSVARLGAPTMTKDQRLALLAAVGITPRRAK